MEEKTKNDATEALEQLDAEVSEENGEVIKLYKEEYDRMIETISTLTKINASLEADLEETKAMVAKLKGTIVELKESVRLLIDNVGDEVVIDDD